MLVTTATLAANTPAAPLIAQFYGTNIERQAQEQIKSGDPVKIDRGNAALAAVGQTASDMVEARLLFGSNFISKTLGITPKNLTTMPTALLEKQAQEKLLPLIVKGTIKGAAAEIPTEVFQQVLERAQAGLPLTSPDAIKEYGDTAYQVGLLGPLGTFLGFLIFTGNCFVFLLITLPSRIFVTVLDVPVLLTICVLLPEF